jgi:hypothetical protein
VNLTAVRPKTLVSADGTGIISQAGAVLLTKTLRVTGLDRQLSGGLQRWRAPQAVHDPGKIITDLAVAVALGGECLLLYVTQDEHDGDVQGEHVDSDIPGARCAVRAHVLTVSRCAARVTL